MMDKRCNTSVLLSLTVIVMQVLFGARAASAQDIPQPLLDYIATLATYKNASFAFECYQDTVSDPSSERVKIGFGTIWLEFDKIAFKEDVMLSDLKGFSSHRLSSHVDGVTTRITENVNKPDSRYVSIGAKDPRPCPYNMLGLGFASSYNLALDPENLRSLADFLIEGAHMGIREIESNSYEIISLGSKKRYSGPWRTDVMIRLDPERRFLPKSIEFRGRSFDDPAADYPLFKYEISEWTTVNGVDFPTVVLETAERIRWVIQKESLQVNDAKFAVDHQLDLKGIRGFDERTNTHINQKVLSPEEKEELERFRQEADASTSIDGASMARINTPAWKNPRVYSMVAASLLIVLGIAWSVARYRRGLGILVLFGNALLLSGCEVRHQHADDGIQTKNALQQLDPGPIVIDYGKDLFVNTRQSARVSFQNVSSKPVQWIDVTTSCGCSKAKWSQETVQPGETVMLVADIDAPEIGTPKSITVRTLYSCGEVQDELIVPITVQYDIDWAVEDLSIYVRGTVNEIGIGEFVVLTKPFESPPKIRFRDNGSIQLAGEPRRRKEDPRRWIYSLRAPIEETGVVSLGDIAIVNDDGRFPNEYQKQVLTEGKSPGKWSKSVLVNPQDSPMRATFECDAGWTVREFKSSNQYIDIHSSKSMDERIFDVELRVLEKIQGVVSVDACLEKEGRNAVSSLKILFARN